MEATSEPYRDSVGRTETIDDQIAPGPARHWVNLLETGDPIPDIGGPIPCLTHWLYCLPSPRRPDLGLDGHLRRGLFLPAIDERARRMWAGSRVSFGDGLVLGQPARRTSEIAAISGKAGSADRLVFVTVRHVFTQAGTTQPLTEEHDIVYREPGRPSKPRPTRQPGRWTETFAADAPLLALYSALTYNGHRIHYDRDYATTVEGYPGLVVHGPLVATLLLNLVRRFIPGPVASYAFRAAAPFFDGDPIHLNVDPPSEAGVVEAWATDGDGRIGMTAQARLEDRRA